METLEELYQDSVKDVYSAEKQLSKVMPKLLKAARNPALKEAIATHIEQTKVQIERLEEVARLGGFKPSGVVCLAAKGLVEENNEHLGEGEPGPVMDAAIVALAQKNEHYEIGTYGSIVAWAKELGQTEALALLKQNLAEEEATDKLLTNIAKTSVNREARSVAIEPAPKKTTKAKPAASK